MYITGQEQPLYSPDLSPDEIWLLPKFKTILKGRKLQDLEYIQQNVATAMTVTWKEEFHRSFQQHQHCWA